MWQFSLPVNSIVTYEEKQNGRERLFSISAQKRLLGCIKAFPSNTSLFSLLVNELENWREEEGKLIAIEKCICFPSNE